MAKPAVHHIHIFAVTAFTLAVIATLGCGQPRSSTPVDTQAQTVQDIDRIIQQNGDRDGSLSRLKEDIQAQKPVADLSKNRKTQAQPDALVIGIKPHPSTLHDPGFEAQPADERGNGQKNMRRDK